MRPLRRLLRAYLSHVRPVTLAIAGAVTAVAMAAVTPLIIRGVIDRAIGRLRPGLLLPLVAGLIAAGAVRAIGFSLRRRYSGAASVATEAALRARLYEHLQSMDLAYHESTPAGQLMSRATSDLMALRELLVKIPVSSGVVLQLAAVTGLMLSFDAGLALLTLAGLPLMWTVGPRLLRRLYPAVYQTQQHLAELTAVVEETVTGIRVVKASGREGLQVERAGHRAEQVFRRANEAIRIRATLDPLFELVPALGLAAVLWYGGHRVIDGHLSFGTFVAFTVYVSQLNWPMRLIGTIAGDAQRAAAAAGRIFEVLDTPPGVADRQGAQPLTVEAGAVRFENVSYRAPDGRLVLDAVDFEVPGGSSMALVGPTGCGKTTLLRLVLRFLEPTDGRVLVDGADLHGVTLESLRAQTATVFEETFLFSDTVAGNVAFGQPGASEEEIIRAAVLAQAHEFVSTLPEGYGTVVGEQGYTLSGGQRQRIAIARAILMQPKILLLDDATSAVDPEVEAHIRAGLARAMAARTSLIVARRPSTAALADRVLYLESGRISATGTHGELWAKLPAYREALAGTARMPAAAGRGPGA